MTVIRKIWTRKAVNQMVVTIPHGEGLKDGDYVEIKKVKLT